MRRALLILLALQCWLAPARAEYTHFEARQVHPIAFTPDGARLVAVHSPAAKLAVFNVAGLAADAPELVAEIPVGLEPVSVRTRTNDEAWVVCEVSDAVYVVSLSQAAVVAVLPVPDEPADVCFAGGKAYVTCARSRQVRVFDALTRAELAPIPLEMNYPRAMTASADGTRLYVADLLSSNGATVLPPALAAAQPPPRNAAVGPSPKVAEIVYTRDARATWTVLDHDVAEVNTATGAVLRYLAKAGANLMDLALEPAGGALWVAATQSRNFVREEPNLRGQAVRNRLSHLNLASGVRTVHDLNAGVNYAQLPNAAAQATALAQPTALAFSADGTQRWVAAFGSDRVAQISAEGAVLQRVEMRGPGEGTRQMRGPRGLALNTAGTRLYVLNKLSDTVSTIHTGAGAVLSEQPLGTVSPLTVAMREGRNFLFDARLSGNGTFSCAACHLDADVDGVAWDLGDRGGASTVVMGANLALHDPTPVPRTMHPMKGPLLTQSLRGIKDGAPFHWRGDRASLAEFNPTFDLLMGGEQIAPAEMEAMANYLFTLRQHPNPNRLRTNALPATLFEANPLRGRTDFNNHQLSHCNVCHAGPRGSDQNIDSPLEIGSSLPIKTPTLGTVYQRVGFQPESGGVSTTGYGLLHNGTAGGAKLPIVHPYVLDTLTTPQQFADITAYVLAFETDTMPVVGASYLLTTANAQAAETSTELTFHEGQAALSRSDFILRGTVSGTVMGLRYVPASARYETADGTMLTRGEVLTLLAPGDFLLGLSVPPGSGAPLLGQP